MAAFHIRAFASVDATAVQDLFVETNRLLAPHGMEAAFESYIERCIAEEIGRIDSYYGARGGFWVVTSEAGSVVGMFGLEPAGVGRMELRRMYVAPSARRAGLATKMLARAERECLRRGIHSLVLSTSELQPAAIALYRARGYAETGSAVAKETSNRTVGGGIRRFCFQKTLRSESRATLASSGTSETEKPGAGPGSFSIDSLALD